MIPGSGANGPEEMMPTTLTLDNQDHSLFQEISDPLNQTGVFTIALGKPGVDFFSSWDKQKWFYDKALYQSLHWQDLLDNVHAAVDYALTQPNVDPKRIYLLGHSEGTQVAVDCAALDSRVKGIILLGYMGADMETVLDWQFYKRDIEFFVATDVDANKDGFVDRTEAAKWPDFVWAWKDDQQKISYAEIEAVLRADPTLKTIFNKMANSPLYSNGIFNRGEINSKTVSLQQDVFVFNGALDMQTPAREALKLEALCKEKHKKNCEISIIPGVGHGFSAPKPPLSQQVVNLTVGPIDLKFQKILSDFAKINFQAN